MEFKQAVRIWKRMCDKHDRCVGCPMYAKVDACPIELCDAEVDIDAILEKWAAEQPETTRMDDFFEKFPNAKRHACGEPTICVKKLGYKTPEYCSNDMTCAECWRQPLEEVE